MTTKIFIVCLILFSLLFNASCKKEKLQKSYRTAAENSAKLMIYGKQIIQANIDSFKAKEISRETLKSLNYFTGKFVAGVKVYEKALDEAEKLIKANGGQVPAGTLEKLQKVFSEEVADKFTAVLQQFNLISAGQSEAIKTAVAGINLAILAIRQALADAGQILKEDFSYVAV